MYPENIFPIINCERNNNTLNLQTTLRIKYRNKWYLWTFERNAFIKNDNNNISPVISSFIRDVYKAMLIKKIDTKAKNSKGEHIYKLDIQQIDELTRLTQPPINYNELDYRYNILLNK